MIVGKIEMFERSKWTERRDWQLTTVKQVSLTSYFRNSSELNMGYVDGHWKINLTGSRFTSDSESRYAPVQEALTLVYGLESCRMFILGCTDLLVTDHLPLVKIFSDRALETIKNTRLLNFKERMLMYRFQIKHRPGKLSLTPDCVSHYPAGTPYESPAQIIDTAVKVTFTSMYRSDPKLKAITWERIVAAATTDEECWIIAHEFQNGFPKLRNDLLPIVRVF